VGLCVPVYVVVVVVGVVLCGCCRVCHWTGGCLCPRCPGPVVEREVSCLSGRAQEGVHISLSTSPAKNPAHENPHSVLRCWTLKTAFFFVSTQHTHDDTQADLRLNLAVTDHSTRSSSNRRCAVFRKHKQGVFLFMRTPTSYSSTI